MYGQGPLISATRNRKGTAAPICCPTPLFMAIALFRGALITRVGIGASSESLQANAPARFNGKISTYRALRRSKCFSVPACSAYTEQSALKRASNFRFTGIQGRFTRKSVTASPSTLLTSFERNIRCEKDFHFLSAL